MVCVSISFMCLICFEMCLLSHLNTKDVWNWNVQIPKQKSDWVRLHMLTFLNFEVVMSQNIMPRYGVFFEATWHGVSAPVAPEEPWPPRNWKHCGAVGHWWWGQTVLVLVQKKHIIPYIIYIYFCTFFVIVIFYITVLSLLSNSCDIGVGFCRISLSSSKGKRSRASEAPFKLF